MLWNDEKSRSGSLVCGATLFRVLQETECPSESYLLRNLSLPLSLVVCGCFRPNIICCEWTGEWRTEGARGTEETFCANRDQLFFCSSTQWRFLVGVRCAGAQGTILCKGAQALKKKKERIFYSAFICTNHFSIDHLNLHIKLIKYRVIAFERHSLVWLGWYELTGFRTSQSGSLQAAVSLKLVWNGLTIQVVIWHVRNKETHTLFLSLPHWHTPTYTHTHAHTRATACNCNLKDLLVYVSKHFRSCIVKRITAYSGLQKTGCRFRKTKCYFAHFLKMPVLNI